VVDLGDPIQWHSIAHQTPAYSYQLEYLLGLEKVVGMSLRGEIPAGVPMCNIWSRQSGKNESNARGEARLLALYSQWPNALEIVKCAPTWRPQCLISKERFQRVTATPLFQLLLKPTWREGYIVSMGNASMKLVSADPKANNVGLTASLYLSADEAQNIQKDRFDVNFSPMTLSTGAPSVMSGTSWHIDSLLEQQRNYAAEMEKRLGIRLLYVYPWDRIAEENARYGEQVEAKIRLYGLDHILIQTQYCCRPIDAAGMLLSGSEVVGMIGDHPRMMAPVPGRIYVAGVDFAGLREQDDMEILKNPDAKRVRDSTVVTIGELIYKVDRYTGRPYPILRVVDHLWITDMDPSAAINQIYSYIFEHWRCVRCVLDSNGVGHTPSGMIAARRPDACTQLYIGATVKSRLGYDLQGAVKTNRLTVYRHDDSPEWDECFFELKSCRRLEVRENNMMKWGAPACKIDGRDVHDDFVLSMAYCLEAAQEHLASNHDPAEYSKRGIFDSWSFNVFEQ